MDNNSKPNENNKEDNKPKDEEEFSNPFNDLNDSDKKLLDEGNEDLGKENMNSKPSFNDNNNNDNNDDGDFSNPFQNQFDDQSNINNQNENLNNNLNDKEVFNNQNNNDDEFSNPFEKDFSDNTMDQEKNNNNNAFNPYINNNNINNDNHVPNNYNENRPYNELPPSNHYPNYNNINSFNNNNQFMNNQNNNNFNPNINNNINNNFNSNNNLYVQNNQSNNQNNNINNNEDVFRSITAIIGKCESMAGSAQSQYETFNIKEAISTICKVIKGLDSVKKTINEKKQFCSSLLPKIISLRKKYFNDLQKYRFMVYKLIPIKFAPVLYRPYDENESLKDFCGKYILNKPFISFDDIFESSNIEENKKMKNIFYYNLEESKKTGNKCFLIFGPEGSGKTLFIHAVANYLGARIAQIEGVELFKIPFFAREYMRACFGEDVQYKPLIVYIKNIEKMFSSINNFNYIYDKVASSYKMNVYLFASSAINVYNLPRQIADKFQYFQCIKPVPKQNKSEFIRFIGAKIGIEIKMDEKSLNEFATEKLTYFSNENIFDLIINAIENKKQYSPPDDENWVYKEGLYEDDLVNALKTVKCSLSEEIFKAYYI